MAIATHKMQPNILHKTKKKIIPLGMAHSRSLN